MIEEIQENSSIQIITKAKNNEAILELLNELLAEMKELSDLKKIESLEKDLINNLDENSYSELIDDDIEVLWRTDGIQNGSGTVYKLILCIRP